ncbi:hypothetical protein ANN_03867 [Periplaneta americana]|uniref:Uncharacterized protein n=1 Tax=Periplaneta americana TaxID=6978 RepID=A0ABQ8U450_PERAM|nr:hypothetical protein ANN_03867 [Periplaneta americana]
MAGLCEGGNEPPGYLKAIVMDVIKMESEVVSLATETNDDTDTQEEMLVLKPPPYLSRPKRSPADSELRSGAVMDVIKTEPEVDHGHCEALRQPWLDPLAIETRDYTDIQEKMEVKLEPCIYQWCLVRTW